MRCQSLFRTRLRYIFFVPLFLAACTTVQKQKNPDFQVEWIRSTLEKENYGFRHSERTAPLLDKETVFQGNGIDGVVSYSQENGRIKWRFNVKNGVESGFAQDEKSLFFGASDGNFYSINKFNGKIIWSFPTRTENLGAPLLYQGVIYFISGNNVLYALDSKTGKQLWNYNRGDASSLSIRGATKPAALKSNLYAGFSDGFLVSLNINDGSLLWERRLSQNLKFVDVDASPVVDDTNIWVSSYDGALYCLSRTDGQVQWRYDEGGSVPVTIEGNTLYFPSLNNHIAALNKTTGNLIWKYKFEEKLGIPTQAILYKSLLLFGQSDGALIALNQSNGEKRAYYFSGNGISASPTLDKDRGYIYVFSNQANLHKLKIGSAQ
jgi:outer membrane protein assembly factor BamB